MVLEENEREIMSLRGSVMGRLCGLLVIFWRVNVVLYGQLISFIDGQVITVMVHFKILSNHCKDNLNNHFV